MSEKDLINAVKMGVITRSEYEFIRVSIRNGYVPVIDETESDNKGREVTITLTMKRFV